MQELPTLEELGKCSLKGNAWALKITDTKRVEAGRSNVKAEGRANPEQEYHNVYFHFYEEL